MKRLVVTIALILLSTITSFAQKTDYTTYNVIAQTKDVSIVIKDNDYRMVVGQLRKPKTVFFLCYSKEQAGQRLHNLLEQADNKNYVSKHRQVRFCGNQLQVTITDSNADDVIYGFAIEGSKVKFTLNKSDIEGFIEVL